MVETKPSILVVDDDDAVRTMVVRQLSALYVVHQAADASAAFAILRDISAPKVIICDVMMPGMSGMQLVERIKQRPALKHVPIIFLTAKTDAADVVEGINAGARHYMTKPFKMNDLLARVAKLVA